MSVDMIVAHHKKQIKKTNLRVNLDCVEKMSASVQVADNNKVLAMDNIASGSEVYSGQATVRYRRAYCNTTDGNALGLLASLAALHQDHKETFEKLMACTEKLSPCSEQDLRKGLQTYYDAEIKTSDELDQLMKQNEHRTLIRFNDNNFSDGRDPEERNLFIGGSKFNHGCRPNCEWKVCDGNIVIRASKNILPGEECTINYWPELKELSSDESELRGMVIFIQAGFICACSAYSAEEDKSEEKLEEKNGENSEEKKGLSPYCRFCKLEDVKLLSCARCKRAQYCNKECQTADWKNHKNSCISK